MPRVKSRQLLPSIIKTRNLGDIITTSPSDALGKADTFSFTFGNGDQAVLTFTLSTKDHTKLFAVPNFTLYQDSVASANALPGGSSIDETEYQFIGPWHDWASTDNKNVKVKLFILNISAGTVTIHGRVLWRYIANNPNAIIVTT